MSIFMDLSTIPPDDVFAVATAFKEDSDPRKVDLGVGSYRTNNGVPYLFPSVRKTQIALAQDAKHDKEYTKITGIPELIPLTQKLVFGCTDDRIASIQSLSGTGALALSAELFRLVSRFSTVHISDPSWANHPNIFKHFGFKIAQYRYYSKETRKLDFFGMIQDLKVASPRDAVILHACAHNPTGVDLTVEQWAKIVEIVKEKQLVPIIDNAYQGFASGDAEKDAHAIREFYKSGMTFFVTESFAKNMGLYGERIGMLHVVCPDAATAKAVYSHAEFFARRLYSNPPINGGRIVRQILGDSQLLAEWRAELAAVSERIIAVRKLLRKALEDKQTPGTWNHITDQIGMFSFTGLTPEQVERIVGHWHVYMMKSGRISMAGLNTGNVDYIATAMDDCVRNVAG